MKRKIKICFEKCAIVEFSKADYKCWKKGKWMKGDLVQDTLKIVKEELFKQIKNISNEEFEKNIRIK